MKTGLRAAALVSLSLLLAAPLAGCGDKQDAGSAAAGEYGHGLRLHRAPAPRPKQNRCTACSTMGSPIPCGWISTP